MALSHRCIGLLTIMSMIACVISCANDTKRRGAAQRGFLARTSTRNWACCAFVAGAKGPDVCLTMKPVGKPDAGNPHVRFDERGGETERCRMAQATAPVLDSTQAWEERRHGCGGDLRGCHAAEHAVCPGQERRPASCSHASSYAGASDPAADDAGERVPGTSCGAWDRGLARHQACARTDRESLWRRRGYH